jgi:predicted RNA-binding Zn ribbon-like protein
MIAFHGRRTMAEHPGPDSRWRLVGGRPCLDLVNTVGGRTPSAAARFADRVTRDDLPDYESLLRWSAFASLVAPGELRRLGRQARVSPSAARRVLGRALRLREAMYRIGRALVERGRPTVLDLRVLDREVRVARQQQQLVSRHGRLETGWLRDPTRLDRVLWPVALSAAAVFASNDVDRLRQCPGAACGWLFLDTTRNHSRQWCAMADCGNLAKVRRFRRRHRSRRPGTKPSLG